MFLIHTAPEHAETMARAVVAACRGSGWCSPLQPTLLHTLFNHLLGQALDFETLEPNTVEEVASTLRSPEERQELIQLMCAIEILCHPVPVDTKQTVEQWANRLGMPERSLVYLRDTVRGEVRKSLEDFYRLNWVGDLSEREPGFEALLKHAGADAYTATVEENPTELARHRALESCPEGSIGRHYWEFYQKRGFKFPGEFGGVSTAVAHHDWIHLVADYGTTPLGEIEVASFQSACTRAPGGTLRLIGTLALFESGAMATSKVTAGRAHQGLSRPHGIDRLVDAIARGKACNTDLVLDVEFFSMAYEPLANLKERFGIPPKRARIQALDRWGALEVEPVE